MKLRYLIISLCLLSGLAHAEKRCGLTETYLKIENFSDYPIRLKHGSFHSHTKSLASDETGEWCVPLGLDYPTISYLPKGESVHQSSQDCVITPHATLNGKLIFYIYNSRNSSIACEWDHLYSLEDSEEKTNKGRAIISYLTIRAVSAFL